MSYCAKVLSPSPQETVENGFCLSSFFPNSQNSNNPAVLWCTCQTVIPPCCTDLTGIYGPRTEKRAAEHLWPHKGSSASLSEWGMDPKLPESPSGALPGMGISWRECAVDEDVVWAVFPCHAEPELLCLHNLWEGIRVIAAGGAARANQAFPWEKNTTEPLVCSCPPVCFS